MPNLFHPQQSDIPMPPSVSSAIFAFSRPLQQNGDEYTSPSPEEEESQSIAYIRAEFPSAPTSPSSSPRSSSDTMYKTKAAYVNGDQTQQSDLPALQADNGFAASAQLEPVFGDDPRSFNLVNPEEVPGEDYSLEKSSQALFSKEHLQVIFADPALLLQFTTFLGAHRPQSLQILVHYLDALKSLRAIHYANAICEGLDPVDGLDFTQSSLKPTINQALEARVNAAFDALAKEELPAFVAHQYIQIVSASITARIIGSLSPHLRDASEGLAEVFCLTDPSRQDNPIVFASEEFNRTTQYGMAYVLGRNCRFLQGPMTNPSSVRRIKDAVRAGQQHQEVLLNYRRDGSPFMNLLMLAPLADNRGVVRYHIGAQVDVSGLVKECADLPSLQQLLELQTRGEQPPQHQKPSAEKSDELRELGEMLNQNELATIRKFGGQVHRDTKDEDEESNASQRPRLLIKDSHTMTPPLEAASGKLNGIYQHYLLVRPYPSLRVLFASPSLRVPGILQSPFMSKIGGSNRVRDELTAAFAEGRGVTAKVRWITKTDDDGRNKWIHCTPLLGVSGLIGVWMVVIVNEEVPSRRVVTGRRHAPPLPERTKTPATLRSHTPRNSDGQMNGKHPGVEQDEDQRSLGAGSGTSLRP